MIRRNKYLIFTSILALFLIIPFYLRLRDNRLEPYPAILLPSGASLIERDKPRVFKKIRLKDDLGNELSIEEVFGGIHRTHIFNLEGSSFGTKKMKDRITFLYTPRIIFFHENAFSKDSRTEVQKWLDNNLSNMGLKSSKIILEKIAYEINPKTYQVQKLKIIDSIIFQKNE
ncbi:hypothetical protein [Zunongwangia atlantica]|uniref:Uncharacterized protein n=1 Tax=Zunongwangia atlantica 22II14-10F7 TaxID=1185767 RepID=A0A1Y1SYC5_9FLAO|nr:hypothetical protein [Zunongwangia atlantica]ORL43759.1 hypothetical protein IIF7_18944 [Zunongwangia atlantica 22II14-10F7]